MDQENAQFFARTDISASNTLYIDNDLFWFSEAQNICTISGSLFFFSGKFPAVLNPWLSQVSDFLGLKFQNQQSII